MTTSLFLVCAIAPTTSLRCVRLFSPWIMILLMHSISSPSRMPRSRPGESTANAATSIGVYLEFSTRWRVIVSCGSYKADFKEAYAGRPSGGSMALPSASTAVGLPPTRWTPSAADGKSNCRCHTSSLSSDRDGFRLDVSFGIWTLWLGLAAFTDAEFSTVGLLDSTLLPWGWRSVVTSRCSRGGFTSVAVAVAFEAGVGRSETAACAVPVDCGFASSCAADLLGVDFDGRAFVAAFADGVGGEVLPDSSAVISLPDTTLVSVESEPLVPSCSAFVLGASLPLSSLGTASAVPCFFDLDPPRSEKLPACLESTMGPLSPLQNS